MYDETKKAVKKALQVGRTLFSMNVDDYGKLLKATSNIEPVTEEDLEDWINSDKNIDDLIVEDLRKKYSQAALGAGFSEDQGIAMLEYAALLEEIKQ